MKFDRVFLFGFNLLSRLFGVLGILVGVVFLVSAYALKENRAINIGVGIFLIGLGVAFLIAKAAKAKHLARMRRRMGSPE
jgi:multisubunit Na+/H+ antiporter MnhG subunit